MPGKRLTAVEKKLAAWWGSDDPGLENSLRAVRIEGDGASGLRGINQLSLNFSYPLTAICGPNGSGKTTILTLASLGYHGAPEHYPVNSKAIGYGVDGDGDIYSHGYYTFKDFFFKGPNDPDVIGLRIGWLFKDGTSHELHKKTNKWMHYERRRSRAVNHLGLYRVMPAIEQSALRSNFAGMAKVTNTKALNSKFTKYLSSITGRQYKEANILESARHAIRTCQNTSSYSSFNMGVGEDALMSILHVLQEAPSYSLVAIEEIEIGIHPQALRRLAQVLIEVIAEKRLQILVTTHSEHFIDAVPRQARVLLQRVGKTHDVLYSPSTNVATGVLSGIQEAELTVVCEDHFAVNLINATVGVEIRRRIHVVPAGDKKAVAQCAITLKKAYPHQKIVCVWDGDVAEADIKSFLKGSSIDYVKLPGSAPPEVEAMQYFLDSPSALAARLGLEEPKVQKMAEELLALPDHHDMCFEFGKALGRDEAYAAQLLCEVFANENKAALSTTVGLLQGALN